MDLKANVRDECKRRILEFNVKVMSFQIGLSFYNEAVVWAILERISFVILSLFRHVRATIIEVPFTV